MNETESAVFGNLKLQKSAMPAALIPGRVEEGVPLPLPAAGSGKAPRRGAGQAAASRDGIFRSGKV